jgi:hypothetical protein
MGKISTSGFRSLILDVNPDGQYGTWRLNKQRLFLTIPYASSWRRNPSLPIPGLHPAVSMYDYTAKLGASVVIAKEAELTWGCASLIKCRE